MTKGRQNRPLGWSSLKLERETQGELHDARRGQRALEGAEAGDIYQVFAVHGVRSVKPHRVGDVEDFPRKPYQPAYAEVPSLVKSPIDGEKAGTTENVALAGFARSRVAEENRPRTGRSIGTIALDALRILEGIGLAAGVDEDTALRFRPDEKRCSRQFKIGGPPIAGGNAEGETGGPAAQSAQSPSAEHGIQETVPGAPVPALAIGNIPNRIEVELLSGVEVGNRTP